MTSPTAGSPATLTFTVEGMTCTGCSGKVTAAVNDLAGVARAQADHVTGAVEVELDGTVSADDLEFAVDGAVTEVGYRVVSA